MDPRPVPLTDADGSPWPPHGKGQNLPGAGVFGVQLFIGSLGVSFLALLAGFIVVRLQARVWVPPGAPALPGILWLSTALIVGCSLAAHAAWRAVRADRQGALRVSLILTLFFAVAFTIAQGFAWKVMIRANDLADIRLYAVTFYLLTGLHAVHVIGGLVLQTWVTARGWQGAYWSYHHPGVTYAVMYWHFLDAVWLLLFAALFWASE